MADTFTIEAPYRGHYSLEEITFGSSGGPSAVIVAGLHGNELNGIHAANLVARTLNMSRLRGRVTLFPVVNSLGLEHGTKRWPFGDLDICPFGLRHSSLRSPHCRVLRTCTYRCVYWGAFT